MTPVDEPYALGAAETVADDDEKVSVPASILGHFTPGGGTVKVPDDSRFHRGGVGCSERDNSRSYRLAVDFTCEAGPCQR